MGNCCKPASSMEWHGEDWSSLTSNKTTRKTSSSKVFDETHGLSLENVKKEKLLGALRASSDANGKVKIKISKKDLADLLGVIEKQHQIKKQVGRASVEQVLFRLKNARDLANRHHDAHQRPWNPVLESIPEVN
ncbi:uncharacterized protein LOC133291262 [Gastrolobium bilobum]|uniref:uncharacterized protein LOC133291262 n=1 Tax=Gastrolobium bilobum TaxID=150636 RepID=UPI002AB1A735|nr:uncharacterized protein LOC133291262 [Gastrolobium bilobum]